MAIESSAQLQIEIVVYIGESDGLYDVCRAAKVLSSSGKVTAAIIEVDRALLRVIADGHIKITIAIDVTQGQRLRKICTGAKTLDTGGEVATSIV